MANIQNLKPLTTERAREIGKKGKIASDKAKKEKKLLSQVYADMLSDKYGKGQKGINLKLVIKGILADGGAPAVSMLREIREATEGSHIKSEMDLSVTDAGSWKDKIKGKLIKDDNSR